MKTGLLPLIAVCFIAFAPAAGALDREQALDAYLLSIRPHRAMLTAFLKEMPKGADLHFHALGGVYAETMIQKTLDSDPPINFDIDAKGFAPSGDLPIRYYCPEDVIGDHRVFGSVLDALSCRKAGADNDNGHDHYFCIYGRFGEASPDLDIAATEIVTRAVAQKIRHLEPVIDPSPPPEKAYKKKADWKQARNLPANNFRRWQLAYPDAEERSAAYAEAVGEAIDAFDQARLNRLRQLDLDDNALTARYILAIDRLLPMEDFEEMLNCLIAAWNRGDGRLAGFTITGVEDAWLSRVNFREQFKLIDRYIRDDANWRDSVRPKFAWHAGELTLDFSTFEAMRNRIGETIWMGHADRIGHGVSIAWEDNVYELLGDMRAKGVCVEICPTANAVVLGVGQEDHPFYLYRSTGVPMVIATDDEGVTRSNLTNELATAAQDYQLSYRELKQLSRNSLEYSFLPGESFFEDRDYGKPKKIAPPNSLKAEMQQRLEKDFVEFEEYMTDRVLKNIVVETDS